MSVVKNNIIPFFKPSFSKLERAYIADIFRHNLLSSGDGKYTKLASTFLEQRHQVKKVLLTTSGTTALEMAVRLLDLPPGSEIICPAYTFSSSANAILMANQLKVVFADIDPRTLNIDPEDVARKITKRTKAIMLVHYAGVACDMAAFLELAKIHHLELIEDAAQAIDAKWNDRYLGTIGSYGCLSFHDTKNIVSGEGGALYINTGKTLDIERAEVVREKGTNRSKFFRGQIDKYTWVDVGSSYLPSDILVAVLYGQLQRIDQIQKARMRRWRTYESAFQTLAQTEAVRLPFIPSYATQNAHMFYLLCRSMKDRDQLMQYLHARGIKAFFHYIPLDTAPMGRRMGTTAQSACKISQKISQRIIRLPLYSGLTKSDQERVISSVLDYFAK